MSDTYKTQCPNCQTVYKVGIQQLAIGYKQARCKRCKQLFVMRDNLVTESLIANANKGVSPAKKPNPTNTSAPHRSATSSAESVVTTIAPAPAATKTVTTTASSRDDATVADDATSPANESSIHDDMEHDDPSSEVEEFKKLQDEWSEEALMKEAVAANNDDRATFFDEGEEDSWLTELLSDDTIQDTDDEVLPIGAVNSNNNDNAEDNEEILNNLLDELGVDTVDVEAVDHEQSMQRMQQRLETKAIGANQKKEKKSILAILLWALGCLGLILLLPAQYMLFNLDNLAKDPANRSKLETFCNLATCSVPGTDLSEFAIPQQTVKSNPDHSNQSDIIATLANTSEQAQLYPALKVSVYSQNGVIGDFIAEPQDYLTVPQRLMSGKKVELFMLSVNIPTQQINRVEISPLY